MNDQKQRDSNWITKLALISLIPWIFFSAILIGYLVGGWLDEKLGSTPWLMVAAVALGAVAAFIEMIRILTRVLK